jgi:hypothetical protein
MRLPSASVLAVLATIVLASCGGGKSDGDKITDVITQTATTTSKENCTQLETQRFVEQSTFETGPAAIKSCETQDSGSNADSVDVSNVQVSGDNATADVAVKGSTFDGQTLKISLVKDGDQWKMEHIDDFVNFDQQALAEGLKKSLTEGANPLSASQAACFASGFENASPSAAKLVILSGKPAALVPLLKRCGIAG